MTPWQGQAPLPGSQNALQANPMIPGDIIIIIMLRKM
jgi:hypothetical protein